MDLASLSSLILLLQHVPGPDPGTRWAGSISSGRGRRGTRPERTRGMTQATCWTWCCFR